MLIVVFLFSVTVFVLAIAATFNVLSNLTNLVERAVGLFMALLLLGVLIFVMIPLWDML